jgi:hypothetical protein
MRLAEVGRAVAISRTPIERTIVAMDLNGVSVFILPSKNFEGAHFRNFEISCALAEYAAPLLRDGRL